MEARHAVLLLLMCTVSGCFGSNLLKKWMLRPHGGHVADKNNSSQLASMSHSNSLPLAKGNPTQEQSKVIIAPTKATSISAEEKRKQRLRKKRKQLKKKIRSEETLKEQSRPLRKCRGSHQCDPTECCIKYGRSGFCKKRPQKGHKCKPRLKPGLEECPCQTGLTCSHYKTNRYGYKKYRCEVLRFKEDERDQA